MTTESVCVVLPAYNEGSSVLGLVPEVLNVLESCEVQPCVCVVDDGSSDGTIDQLVALRQTEPRLVVVQLSRNFGHQAALLGRVSERFCRCSHHDGFGWPTSGHRTPSNDRVVARRI